MKLYAKLLAIAASIALVTGTTTSCTPEEAAVGGALVGAAAAIAIMDSNNHGRYSNRGGGYRGGGYRGGGHYWH